MNCLDAPQHLNGNCTRTTKRQAMILLSSSQKRQVIAQDLHSNVVDLFVVVARIQHDGDVMAAVF